MKFKFQLVDVSHGERPEYEDEDNPNWRTVLEADIPEDLLLLIADWLNDENYPTNSWSRIKIE